MKRLFNRLDHVIEFNALVKNRFGQLTKLKEENKRQEFDSMLAKLLPRVRLHIASKLISAVVNEQIEPNKYKVDDFISDLYLIAFEGIQEVKDEEFFESWLVAKADQLLEDAIDEHEVDEFFIQNIDDFTEVEWESMIEIFSTDGDGDLVMEEELDDLSYPKYRYTLHDVFVENDDQRIIEELSERIRSEQIHQHVDFISHRLPSHLRTAFILSLGHHFTPQEVAQIQQEPQEQIIKDVNEAILLIRKSFVSRYLTEKLLK